MKSQLPLFFFRKKRFCFENAEKNIIFDQIYR